MSANALRQTLDFHETMGVRSFIGKSSHFLHDGSCIHRLGICKVCAALNYQTTVFFQVLWNSGFWGCDDLLTPRVFYSANWNI